MEVSGVARAMQTSTMEQKRRSKNLSEFSKSAFNKTVDFSYENEMCPDVTIGDVTITEIDVDEQVKVDVSVVFLKIGEIDTIKEQYSADVLVKSKWRTSSLDRAVNEDLEKTQNVDIEHIWNPRIYIENTLGDPKESIYRSVLWNDKGEAFVQEKRRVKGVFLENLELNDFPFDVQDLTVTIASDRPTNEVEVVSDPVDLHRINKQSFVDEQEWLLYKHIEAEQTTLTYEHADPTFVRQALSVKCRAARRPAYFFWNIFLITFLICSLSFATFAVTQEKPENRLQLSFTLVLTSVAFKFVVNQSLPKISYLTYLDKYVLASMIMLNVVCVWHAIIGSIAKAVGIENKKKARDIETGVLCFLIGFYFLYNLAFSIRIYSYACRRRRIMKQKDREYMDKVKTQVTKQRRLFRRQTTREIKREDSTQGPSESVDLGDEENPTTEPLSTNL
ncbi:cys-loop ligand-gated ion channel-like [Tubulanus polymorphus]|uniref:cys-loop ligand-gated ion channel-like n=1 Tax=Tubulanus polymorphus TaxID=672921 RepID=UPI003DA23BB1